MVLLLIVLMDWLFYSCFVFEFAVYFCWLVCIVIVYFVMFFGFCFVVAAAVCCLLWLLVVVLYLLIWLLVFATRWFWWFLLFLGWFELFVCLVYYLPYVWGFMLPASFVLTFGFGWLCGFGTCVINTLNSVVLDYA